MIELRHLVRDRVALGAAKLDEIEPDWYNIVDDFILDLASPYFCVIGQIVRFHKQVDVTNMEVGFGYFHFKSKHNIDAMAMGFEAESLGTIRPDDQYDALNREWLKVMAARRSRV